MNKPHNVYGMIAVFAALALNAAFADPAPVTESAESVLQRIYPAHYRGRPSILQSMVTSGEIEAFGLTGTFTRRFVAPDKWDVTLDFGVAKFVQGYDGNAGWTIDQNGSLLELSGHELEALVSDAYLSNQSFLLDNNRAGVQEYLGPLTQAGRGSHEFRFFPPGGSVLEVVIDSLNGAVLLSRTKIDDIQEETTYSDFRDVDGFAIPFQSRTVVSVKELNVSSRVTACDVNTEIDPYSFTRRQGVYDDVLFPFESDSVVVPLETGDGLLFVVVRVNGSGPLLFLLDSGAGANVITPAAAEALGLVTAGEIAVKGIAGYESAGLVRLRSLAIGDVELVEQTIGALDLPPQLTSGAGTISGVLGYDFFSRLTVTIDFEAAQMIMYRPDFFNGRVGRHELAGYYKFPLRFFSKIPHVAADIAGELGEFVVDLGSSLGIIVHRAFAASAGLDTLAAPQSPGLSAAGVGGALGLTELALQEFSLGSLSMKNVSAQILSERQGMSATREIAGNLGTRFWKDFRLTIDYSSRRIFLLPRE